MSRRERRTAFRAALAAKAAAECIHVTHSWGEATKTRERAMWLAERGLVGRVLLVDVDPSAELRSVSGNIGLVDVVRADSLAVHEVVRADHIVVTPAALECMRDRSSHGTR